MRYLRWTAVIVFILSFALSCVVNIQYNAEQDTNPPTITSDTEELEVSVESDQDALLQGLTAHDEKDGDLTDKILVASISRFLEPGTVRVKYVVFDSNHNAATYTRKVRYTDYVPPRFSLQSPLVYTRGQNIRYLNYITAKDVLDGDITDRIKVKASNVSNYTPGTYPVLLEVANSRGDTVQVELNVVVLDKNTDTARITLKEYLTYIKTGDSFDPYRCISSVTMLNGIALSATDVSILGTVDTEEPGCYDLIYRYNKDGIEASAYLTVVVEEQEG